jgi:hypothetical protein
MFDKKIIFCCLILCLAIGAFAGCATLNKATSRENENLRQAVENFYTYQKDGEFRKAFQYENRSLSEGADPQYYASRYAQTGIVTYGFEILDIGKEGTGPDGYTPVKIKLITSWPTNLGMPVPERKNENVFEDLWVRKEGKWYHILRGMMKYW